MTETYTHGLGTPSPTLTDSGTEVDTIATNATFNNRSNLVRSLGPIRAAAFFWGRQQTIFITHSLPQAPARRFTKSAGCSFRIPTTIPPTTSRTPSRRDRHGSLLQLPFKSGNSWDAGSGYVETSTSDSTVNGSVPSTNKGVSTWNEDGTYTNDWSNVANDGSYTGYTDVTTVKADGTSIETYTDRLRHERHFGRNAGTCADGHTRHGDSAYADVHARFTGTDRLADRDAGAELVPEWGGALAAAKRPFDRQRRRGHSRAVQRRLSIATSAEQIHEIYTSSIRSGEVNVTSDSYYVSGIGMVCSSKARTIRSMTTSRE